MDTNSLLSSESILHNDYLFYMDNHIDENHPLYDDFEELRKLDDTEETSTPTQKKPQSKYLTSKRTEASYYANLSKFPPMKKDEELLLFTKLKSIDKTLEKHAERMKNTPEYRKLERERKKVFDEIVTRNLRYVVKIAKSFHKSSRQEDFEDYVCAGNIGLIHAIDKFKPQLGNRFLTYATHWIALRIRECIGEMQIIILPSWWKRTIHSLRTAFTELAAGLHEDVEIPLEELADRTKITLKKLQEISLNGKTMRWSHIPNLGSSTLFNEDCATYYESGDSLSLNQTVEKDLERAQIKRKLNKALSTIDENQMLILKQRFGFFDHTPKNLRQISNIIGKSSERVRQLQVKGASTVKEILTGPIEEGGLDDYQLAELG